MFQDSALLDFSALDIIVFGSAVQCCVCLVSQCFGIL